MSYDIPFTKNHTPFILNDWPLMGQWLWQVYNHLAVSVYSKILEFFIQPSLYLTGHDLMIWSNSWLTGYYESVNYSRWLYLAELNSKSYTTLQNWTLYIKTITITCIQENEYSDRKQIYYNEQNCQQSIHVYKMYV